jgi:hypothetical protein
MPTPPSIVERIAVNIEQTLQNYAGYTNRLAATRRRAKSDPRHLVAEIYQLSEEPVEDAGIMTDEWWQPFAVVVYVMPADNDRTPVDTYNNAAKCDLEKAIMADYTRGNLAFETRVRETHYFPAIEGEYGGITFNFAVRYRTVVDDPFTAAIS